MIAKVLVFVCAAVGVVAGSCFEIKAPQECSSSQVISLPVPVEASASTPVLADNIFSSRPSNFISSGCSGSFADNIFSSSLVSAPSVSENFFSSGLQAVNGPETSAISALRASDVSLPAVEGPVVSLSSQSIPAPRVLSHRCVCTKTILRPQVYQRTITVPKIQRYLKRTVTPVVENIAYRSTPITQDSSSGSGAVVLSSGSGYSSSPVFYSSGSYSSSSPVVVSSGSGSCDSEARYVSAPVVVSSESSCPRVC